jgi:hypothetical protein
VAELGVLNASPLIVLAHIGQEHLFQALADEIVIPRAAAEEIEAGPAGDPARQAIGGGQFLVVDAVPSPEILAWVLGMGETAANGRLREPCVMEASDDQQQSQSADVALSVASEV